MCHVQGVAYRGDVCKTVLHNAKSTVVEVRLDLRHSLSSQVLNHGELRSLNLPSTSEWLNRFCLRCREQRLVIGYPDLQLQVPQAPRFANPSSVTGSIAVACSSALMSFGRHAYRHAVQPSSHALLDHVWVSEDLLAATFRRFANSQRRYESRVPGPLEARRRLAKRRNTALAGMAGFGPLDDIACLFGRNGREHMKWSDGQSRKAPMETGGEISRSTTRRIEW